MTNFKVLQGLKSNLPTNGTDDGSLYFTNDTGELFKSNGVGSPLVKLGDILSGYVDLADLQAKNPQLEGKIYLTNGGELYVYRNNAYELVTATPTLPISANDISETSQKVFVTSSEQAQITSNQNELASHSQRIANLEASSGGVSTDEKVKMDASGLSGYLEDFIDTTTLQNIGGKLTATSLDGLTATLTEINHLQGVSGNIQAQIDALNNIGQFRTSVANYYDLSSLTNPQASEMVIVLSDETQPDAPSAIYVYNGTDWVFSGEFRGGEIRNFTTNPLNLDSETTGILSKTKYEKQNASETPITDASGNLVATNVEDALAELFTYANNIKSIANVVGSPLTISDTSIQLNTKMQQLKDLLASYLTQKGVPAYSYNTLMELINKVMVIPNVTVEGKIKKISKLNVTAPYELRIPLDEALSLSDITTTPIEFVQGATGVVHYNVGFDNGDASDFEQNDNVEFDGVMKLKTLYKIEMIMEDSTLEAGSLHRKTVINEDWFRIDKVNVARR